ncbi:UDP-N-acetylglucosamine 1-carboxyvinyltransferase [Candidatus Pelagibacter sp.]|nr:UDP-N-acetylglucosamine 1-carboxyvinyltransferase [Candidatus Pelagibacter sp.]
MKRFIITGPSKAVNGIVNISGAKNSCLPLMAASILFKKEVILRNVPLVQDVFTMKDLLISLGSKVKILEKKKIMIITNKNDHKLTVPYNLVSTMRAGVLTMGSLLGRYPKKNIRVALGGGCALGIRDTSWHLEGFKSLGAEHVLEKGYVKISSKNGLVGKSYKFPKITVTGTSNLIMSSVFVRGSHVLKNISLEPEVTDLIKFLNNSGANIRFIGKRSLRIKGVKELLSGNHKIIGDRIEAFSYLCVGAITKGNVKVANINPKFLPSELKILKKIGFKIDVSKNYIKLNTIKKLKPINVKTGPWPGFATDCLPILIPVLTRIFGQSKIKETIFTNRFMAVPELNRMGADIKIKKNFAVVNGEKKLNSADCISSDLRTTFSIILGAIAAKGSSTISRIYHGLRGYSNLQLKLRKLGIKVKMKI